MDAERFVTCLAADEARLREAAADALGAVVPTCPEWTVSDLVEHVALVYLHKVECMRTGPPAGWPPPLDPEPPLALLDRAYEALVGEFAARAPGSASFTWYEPDQTVGFWARRMAQETAIHRVDAELAVGVPVTPIPDDLAADGIDEVLARFLAYGSTRRPGDFGAGLSEADGSTVLVAADDRAWLVRMEPTGVVVAPADPGAPASARVGGDPHGVLLWLWRRTDAAAITYEGDPAALCRLRDLLGTATR